LYAPEYSGYIEPGTDITDIALVQSLHDIPADKSILATETSQQALSWYQDPNIEYYAGRTLNTRLLQDGVPFADYQLVPPKYVQQLVDKINQGVYGPSVKASIAHCSTNICLVSLVRH